MFDKRHVVFHNKTSEKYKIGVKYYFFSWHYFSEWLRDGADTRDLQYDSLEEAQKQIIKTDNCDTWVEVK